MERLTQLTNERIINEFTNYIQSTELCGDEYTKEYLAEIQRRLRILTELQELEGVRKTW